MFNNCRDDLKSDKPTSTFESFKDALEAFGEVFDQVERNKKELQKLSEKQAKADAETKNVHAMLKTRLDARKPVEDLAPQTASKLTQVARDRGAEAQSLAAPDDELVRYLNKMYEWGVNELSRCQGSVKGNDNAKVKVCC